MANAKTRIRKVNFEIKDDITICDLFYEGDEPGTPWGGGWKTKSFPPSVSIIDFIKDEAANYLLWPDGREITE
jgi:hypothetical protein